MECKVSFLFGLDRMVASLGRDAHFQQTMVNRLEMRYGGMILTEKSDVVIRAQTVSANNMDVISGYDLVLVKNT